MPKYIIPVTWAVASHVEVEADTLDEAKQKADDAPLPIENSEYIDGSFEINDDIINEVNPDLCKFCGSFCHTNGGQGCDEFNADGFNK